MNEVNETQPQGTKPQLSVKIMGVGYVGNGWVNQGQYGTYYSVKVNQDIPAGSKIIISARKGEQVELS